MTGTTGHAMPGRMLFMMMLCAAATRGAALAQDLVQQAPPVAGDRPAAGPDRSSLRVRLEPWNLTVAPLIDSVSLRVVALEVILPAGPPRRIEIDAVDCDAGSLKIEERNGEALVTMEGWRAGSEEREPVRCLWRIDIRTWSVSERPELRPLRVRVRD